MHPKNIFLPDVSRALQNNLRENIKPEITFMARISSCDFVHTEFQLEILVRSMISAIHE